MHQFTPLFFGRGLEVGFHVLGVGCRSGLPLSINCRDFRYEGLALS